MPLSASLIITAIALAAVALAVALAACVSPGASILFIVAAVVIGLAILWS